MLNIYDKKIWIKHLNNDIMPFWCNSEMLGNPIGNFPSFANQKGEPIPGQPHYLRMMGRQIYGYLVAYSILKDKKYLKYAESGFAWLERHGKNTEGIFWSQLSPVGTPIRENITIQDLCYSVLPYFTRYRLFGHKTDIVTVIDVIRFICNGPFCKNDILFDSLKYDSSQCYFMEGDCLNLVSILDLLNLLLVPIGEMMNQEIEDLFPEFYEILTRFVEILVKTFWSNGIFWNNASNRLNYSAKHVDFGHTSKAYGIIFRANKIMFSKTETVKYQYLEEYYIPMLHAASCKLGWATDFKNSNTTFVPGPLQWWRHIVINQTAIMYSSKYKELHAVIENGLKKWLELPFVDKKRSVRGIRESLQANGTLWSNKEEMTCKANSWKNAYHEIEHVAYILNYIADLNKENG